MSPKVSIVLPVYNTKFFLSEAIESLCAQSYQNWELIIGDDRSNDGSQEIIKDWVQRDKRIKAELGKINIGQAKRLDSLIKSAKTELIAIQDSDDISLPERLKTQLNYFQRKKLDLVGSWAKRIDETGRQIGNKTQPDTHLKIMKKLCLGNPFVHTSIMMKKSVYLAVGGYANLSHSQDFDLWSRIVQGGYKVGNVPQFLVGQRQHSGQKSVTGKSKQIQLAGQIAYENYRHFVGGKISLDDYQQMIAWRLGQLDTYLDLPRVYLTYFRLRWEEKSLPN